MNRVTGVGLEIITRLRDDANLLYPYVGPQPKRQVVIFVYRVLVLQPFY